MIRISAKKARPSSSNRPRSKPPLNRPGFGVVRDGPASLMVGAPFSCMFDHRFAGGGHDLFLGHVGAELRRDLALAHDDDAMGDAQAFGDFRSGKYDGEALGGPFGEQFEDFGLGADVDAAARLVEQDDAG